MKISIVIPIFNVAQYLETLLDSVINQSHKDIEIICINDGSTDNSLSILHTYAKRDNRIQVVDIINSGPFVVRQIGMKMATGDYVTFVDGDDWLALDTCELIAKTAENTDADIIQYDVMMEYNDTSNSNIKAIEKWFSVDIDIINNSDEMLRLCYMEKSIPWNIATKAIKTSITQKVASYIEPLRIHQLDDFLTCFYLFMLSQSWVHLDSKLYHYRYGTGISTKRTTNSKEFELNLEYYKGVRALQQFAEQMTPSKIALQVAFEAIPQYAIEDSMHFIMRLDDKDDYCKWSDIWARAIGSEQALHALAANMLRINEKWMHAEKRMKKKRAKYRMLLWIMGAVTVALLVALLSVEL